MSDLLLSYGITTYVSQDILIVSFQSDFYVEVIEALRQNISHQLHQKPQIKGLVVELSKVKVIDFQNMLMLEQLLHTASILGVIGFLVGIQPSVTLALVELGYEQGQIRTGLNIERATHAIHELAKIHEMPVERVAPLEEIPMEDPKQASDREMNNAN